MLNLMPHHMYKQVRKLLMKVCAPRCNIISFATSGACKNLFRRYPRSDRRLWTALLTLQLVHTAGQDSIPGPSSWHHASSCALQVAVQDAREVSEGAGAAAPAVCTRSKHKDCTSPPRTPHVHQPRGSVVPWFGDSTREGRHPRRGRGQLRAGFTALAYRNGWCIAQFSQPAVTLGSLRIAKSWQGLHQCRMLGVATFVNRSETFGLQNLEMQGLGKQVQDTLRGRPTPKTLQSKSRGRRPNPFSTRTVSKPNYLNCLCIRSADLPETGARGHEQMNENTFPTQSKACKPRTFDPLLTRTAEAPNP